MGILADIEAIKDVQKIKNGEIRRLSISQITGLITNMSDAKKNLTEEEFFEVQGLFLELRKCNTKIPMSAEKYIETAIDIIKKFDAIAPYEKYSGGNEVEFSFLMKDIREEKILEEEIKKTEMNDLESDINYLVEASNGIIEKEDAIEFMKVIQTFVNWGKNKALEEFDTFVKRLVEKNEVLMASSKVAVLAGVLKSNTIINENEMKKLVSKYQREMTDNAISEEVIVKQEIKKEEMTKQDILSFGVQQVVNILEKDNYTIEAYNSKVGTYPNVVAKKNNQLYGFLVEANEVRKQPKLRVKDSFNMMKFAKKFKAIPMYASIGIGAANHQRFEEELLLKNDPDGFYINFTGFEEINIDNVPEKNTIEYKEYVVSLFGLCYEKNDFSPIYKFMDDKCKWFSYWSQNEYIHKQEIQQYYSNKVKFFQNTIINYFLIKFVGNYFEIKSGEAILPDGSKKQNVTIKVPQPDGEIGMVVEQIKEDNTKVSMAVSVGFNEDGLINNIYIGDPYAMKFIDYK